MKKYYLEDRSKILIDDSKPIGTGGEGSVFKLAKNPNILVKIYTDRALERMPDIEQKIKAMVARKPGLLDYNGLTIIAWPSYVVYDEFQRFVGYLMRRVQAKNHLSHVITPGLQKQKFPNITWYDRLVIAINLAKVMSFIHKNDTVIGDINTSDFFVYPAFEIGVVDTDSFQVSSENQLFHCKVFTPDYTPPEVIEAKKRSKTEIKRLPNQDNYGLAILIFQILMMGVHPFSARVKGTLGFDGNAINYCMENEIFPYQTHNQNIIPPKNAMPFNFFPKHIQDLFVKAFSKEHSLNRPTSDQWVDGLKTIKENIKRCRKNKAHYYPNHFQKCPICAREQTKDYDYLLDYFKTISRKFVKYETDNNPIIVDENHVYDESLVSKRYPLKNNKHLAVFFNSKMIDKFQLTLRIEKLKDEKIYQKLRKYFSTPLQLIYENQNIIGYTIKKTTVSYRLSFFLKNNRLGKLKITDKVKIVVARNIANMFSAFEKYNITVEFNQIFIDKNLNVSIPDLVFMGTQDNSIKAMTFQKEDYLPQEYYMYQRYQKYQADIEAQLEKEREAIRKIEEEQRLKDLELIRSPLEPKPAKVIETKEVAIEIKATENIPDFEFEKSHEISAKKDAIQEPEIIIPEKIDNYDPKSKQTSRFQLSIIIHIVLQNVHPFKGTYKLTDKPISFFIEQNYFLHKQTFPDVEISEKALLIELFPKYYQNGMKKALHVTNPLKINRTSPSEWSNILSRMLFESRQCLESEYHYYHQNITKCPTCSITNNADHNLVRRFVVEYKKGVVHHLLYTNKFFNYMLVSLMIVLSIYWINANQIRHINDLLVLFNFEDKLRLIESLIDFERILRFFGNIFDYLVNLYRLIFGGAS
jgi:DNA-binding helix-hairpin-helix protein with protein kinase domain